MPNINKLTLIKKLESIPLFDGRFKDIEVINCDRSTGIHKPNSGVLSVIFKAFDIREGCNVAIKFFDPDISLMTNGYRFELFVREVEILRALVSNKRHLQLLQDLKSFNLTLSSSQNKILVVTQYFVIEWIEYDALDFFHNHQNFDAEIKLNLFRNICLSLFSLHQLGIYHRDLKPENFRIRNLNSLDVVILDFGTSAFIDSPTIGLPSNYKQSVGTPFYTPIEGLCGLSGVREIGVFSDIYSLGCMLYELFNINYFSGELFKDSGFISCFGTCQMKILSMGSNNISSEQLIKVWSEVISQTSTQVNRPKIDDCGNSLLPSVKSVLLLLLDELTKTNYIYRVSDNNRVIRLIDSALRGIAVNLIYLKRKKFREISKLNKQNKNVNYFNNTTR